MGLDNGSRIQVPGQVQIKAQYTPTDAAFPVSLNAGNGNELTSIVFGGLTKREYAAVQIAGQLVPAYDRAELVTNPAFRGLLAAEAVAIADAVLAAAREPQPEPTA